MRKSKYTDEQIADALRRAQQGAPIADVCRDMGISEATFYNWRAKFGGLTPTKVNHVKQLEKENAKLKRLVANLSLDKAMLQDVLSKKA
ncbi:Hin recombinase [Burkholderia sp. MSMB617WGS]|uniref:Hin recombinase n=1 Tax=Burkholderia savannae TaxID=1637837 RepID=A0ABR5T8B4_9BURK|nr:transposase [Burkholderia savannae]AOK51243.1 Hin recombinase [Burkholderia sp. MSMB617WGS]KGR96524.1 transposase family protein [Burkholderia sp. ABCPW 111]KVG38573.1 Hin recombinase [Burkholderia sp. MSMB0265]KVG87217.1 Hin recombinase [Burkholderia sp. MSMB2040]KVG94740.1 Hin recombinase [Burkholderia sp. MSMB2041]KVG96568.1 Hin recombinase [Burkholderia sp. MSMB2042]KVK90143.1 Hin recombinase [Burkholderia sp. MSMB1498]